MKTEIASIFSNVLLPLKHHFSQKTNCDENILKRHTAFLWDISHKVHERRLIPSFLTGAFYNFLLLSFQIKVNIKRKILELLSACGKMKKEKARLSRFWQHDQLIKHCFCVWQAPTSLGLQSGLLWDMHKNIQIIISLLKQSKFFICESLLQMNSHQCRMSNPHACHWDALSWTPPNRQRQESQSMGSTGQGSCFPWLPTEGRGNPTTGETGTSQLDIVLILLRHPCSR